MVVVKLYDTASNLSQPNITLDYNLSDIVVKRGDNVQIVYIEDKDGNGITSRIDALIGDTKEIVADLINDRDDDSIKDRYDMMPDTPNVPEAGAWTSFIQRMN